MAVEHEDDSGRLVRLIHLDDLSDDDLGTVRDLMQRVVRLERAARDARAQAGSTDEMLRWALPFVRDAMLEAFRTGFQVCLTAQQAALQAPDERPAALPSLPDGR